MLLTAEQAVKHGHDLIWLSLAPLILARVVRCLMLTLLNIGRWNYSLSVCTRVMGVFHVWILQVAYIYRHLSFSDYWWSWSTTLSSGSRLVSLLGCSGGTTFCDLNFLPLLIEWDSGSRCTAQELRGDITRRREILIRIQCHEALIVVMILKISCLRFLVLTQRMNR